MFFYQFIFLAPSQWLPHRPASPLLSHLLLINNKSLTIHSTRDTLRQTFLFIPYVCSSFVFLGGGEFSDCVRHSYFPLASTCRFPSARSSVFLAHLTLACSVCCSIGFMHGVARRGDARSARVMFILRVGNNAFRSLRILNITFVLYYWYCYYSAATTTILLLLELLLFLIIIVIITTGVIISLPNIAIKYTHNKYNSKCIWSKWLYPLKIYYTV